MSNNCVESGRTPSNRYPYIGVGGKVYRESRYVWASANGPIPDGMVVCHSCDNPRCINLDHLFVGTQAENLRDMVDKGRSHGWCADKTQCPTGHAYDGVDSRGRRTCSACIKRNKAAYRLRVKERANG